MIVAPFLYSCFAVQHSIGYSFKLQIPEASLLKATLATNTTGTMLFTKALLDELEDDGQIVILYTAMALF
ncbi:hypothetical protein [Pedobacter sp. CFBP9032]|uniref:hypothetical protein n=1 Tax=Pedobacter sp. CFBP9032 TaxID=3096539 RepID=UPI002A69F275|nr:hypothetical protein [Pedobacter sp. CFBP9032]MDY0904707.1 hypothetical protein [Pedobacter sp. CFBP9032]